jgi:hypothetical protein
MLDQRIVLSDNIIQDFQEKRSLLELIMTNWVDLVSLQSIVHNVMLLRQPEFGGYYGIFRMTNDMFLNLLRNKLTKQSLKMLGVQGKSNNQVLKEVQIISDFLKGRVNGLLMLTNRFKKKRSTENPSKIITIK